MPNRLFSTDKRTETILTYCKEQNVILSKYICNAVVDETLPVYSQLRIEALYLLDLITDGAKEWTGNKLIQETGTEEIQYYTRQTLGRGMSWLGNNHHIKNCSVLRDVLSHYHVNEWDGAISYDKLNVNVQKIVDMVLEKIREIDNSQYSGSIYMGLGALAGNVLNHWDELWDWNESYTLLSITTGLENPLREMDPFYAIKVLQTMENQFIIESIGEKK